MTNRTCFVKPRRAARRATCAQQLAQSSLRRAACAKQLATFKPEARECSLSTTFVLAGCDVRARAAGVYFAYYFGTQLLQLSSCCDLLTVHFAIGASSSDLQVCTASGPLSAPTARPYAKPRDTLRLPLLFCLLSLHTARRMVLHGHLLYTVNCFVLRKLPSLYI